MVKNEAETIAGACPGGLIRQVRMAVTGAAALFVSNRDDPQLERTLEAELGLDLDWCVSNTRRIQAAAKRIRGGRYRLIIVATGFVSHSVDQVLGKAARSAGVPLVRAYKGRFRATVHAIAGLLDSLLVVDSDD